MAARLSRSFCSCAVGFPILPSTIFFSPPPPNIPNIDNGFLIAPITLLIAPKNPPPDSSFCLVPIPVIPRINPPIPNISGTPPFFVVLTVDFSFASAASTAAFSLARVAWRLFDSTPIPLFALIVAMRTFLSNSSPESPAAFPSSLAALAALNTAGLEAPVTVGSNF